MACGVRIPAFHARRSMTARLADRRNRADDRGQDLQIKGNSSIWLSRHWRNNLKPKFVLGIIKTGVDFYIALGTQLHSPHSVSNLESTAQVDTILLTHSLAFPSPSAYSIAAIALLTQFLRYH